MQACKVNATVGRGCESCVILINIFHVKPEDGDRLIEAWGADATMFQTTARLHLHTTS